MHGSVTNFFFVFNDFYRLKAFRSQGFALFITMGSLSDDTKEDAK